MIFLCAHTQEGEGLVVSGTERHEHLEDMYVYLRQFWVFITRENASLASPAHLINQDQSNLLESQQKYTATYHIYKEVLDNLNNFFMILDLLIINSRIPQNQHELTKSHHPKDITSPNNRPCVAHEQSGETDISYTTPGTVNRGSQTKMCTTNM